MRIRNPKIGRSVIATLPLLAPALTLTAAAAPRAPQPSVAAVLTPTPSLTPQPAPSQTHTPPHSATPTLRHSATPQSGYTVLARNCLKCHGGDAPLAGLNLGTLASAQKGGKHGAALVPGDPSASRLWKMVTGKLKPQMPPTGALSDADQAVLKSWIAGGARYPSKVAAADDGKWWSFRPLSHPTIPPVKDAWVKNPVDAFVLARMKQAGVRPSPPADRVTLIRRAYFDMVGLPPSPDEIDRFVNDRSPNAWEKVVDHLLASPQYGERWARHWLDLARFAESEGFKADETRPNAWRYRDYVIRSFNEDKPYNRFLKEQIAGDEIDPENPDALIATGFNRHWADESNARNIPLRRQEILNDITDTVGSVFMGVTLGCARCHDHKYDPIPQKDYYGIQSFFAAIEPRKDIPLLTDAQRRDYEAKLGKWEQATRVPREQLASLEAPYRAKLLRGKLGVFPDEVKDAVLTPPEKRTAIQWAWFHKVADQVEIKDEEVGKGMKGDDRRKWDGLQAELKQAAPLRPADPPTALGITDFDREAPKTFTLSVGVYDRPIAEVQPGFLSVVDPAAAVVVPPKGLASTGRRTALANWLARPENPLTSRVIVNRVWQYHFGKGLAASTSDLGRTGELPTHPELLDWLASTFVSSGPPVSKYGSGGVAEYAGGGEPGQGVGVRETVGVRSETRSTSGPTPNPTLTLTPIPEPPSRYACNWSLKRLHHLILTSSTYQQASSFNATAAAKDPEDRLLWRYQRWRLEGEVVRDSCLAVSGELNPQMGGPSIFPELPAGVSTRGGWTVSPDERQRNRRSVYVFVRRNLRYPLFQAFDFPDTHEPCARRSVTNTAPQALMLFNSQTALDFARGFAGRLMQEASTPEGRVERAYRLAFGRAPESAEREMSLRFLKNQSELVRKRIERKEPVALPKGATGDPAEGAAMVDFCHALFNANEFLYVD